MEIKLPVEILQVAMTVDEARQNGLALDVDHLRVGRNRDVAASTHRLEPARLNNDDGILDRRPPGAIDQSSTLHHECLLCHVFFSPSSRSTIATKRIFLLTLRRRHAEACLSQPAPLSLVQSI